MSATAIELYEASVRSNRDTYNITASTEERYESSIDELNSSQNFDSSILEIEVSGEQFADSNIDGVIDLPFGSAKNKEDAQRRYEEALHRILEVYEK